MAQRSNYCDDQDLRSLSWIFERKVKSLAASQVFLSGSLIRVPETQSIFFIRVHNETLSVAAMCVRNEDRSPARVYSCDTGPGATGFAEIVRAQS